MSMDRRDRLALFYAIGQGRWAHVHSLLDDGLISRDDITAYAAIANNPDTTALFYCLKSTFNRQVDEEKVRLATRLIHIAEPEDFFNPTQRSNAIHQAAMIGPEELPIEMIRLAEGCSLFTDAIRLQLLPLAPKLESTLLGFAILDGISEPSMEMVTMCNAVIRLCIDKGMSELIGAIIERLPQGPLLHLQENDSLLHYAVERREREIVQLLLDAIPEMALITRANGAFPIHCYRYPPPLEQWIQLLDVMSVDDLTSVSRCGGTVLHFTVLLGLSLPFAQAVLDRIPFEARWITYGSEKMTPLDMANAFRLGTLPRDINYIQYRMRFEEDREANTLAVIQLLDRGRRTKRA